MKYNSNLNSFYFYLIAIIVFVTVMSFILKNYYVLFANLTIIFLWFTTKLESNDYELKQNRILIYNRLKFVNKLQEYNYSDIESVLLLNEKHTRHPYQRIEINLKSGLKRKFASSKISENDFSAMCDFLNSKGVKTMCAFD
jgi:hypothetical protein